jgi:hypothetical protein
LIDSHDAGFNKFKNSQLLSFDSSHKPVITIFYFKKPINYKQIIDFIIIRKVRKKQHLNPKFGYIHGVRFKKKSLQNISIPASTWRMMMYLNRDMDGGSFLVYFLPLLGGQKAAVLDSVEGWCAAGNLGASRVLTGRMDRWTTGWMTNGWI